MSALLLACLDLRGAALLPAVLPAEREGVPVVYLDGDGGVYCAACANEGEDGAMIRPFIQAFDLADPDDECSECGCSFAGVSHV